MKAFDKEWNMRVMLCVENIKILESQDDMTDDEEEQTEISKHISTLDNNIELFRKKFEQEKYQKHQEKLMELSTEELIEQLTNNTI